MASRFVTAQMDKERNDRKQPVEKVGQAPRGSGFPSVWRLSTRSQSHFFNRLAGPRGKVLYERAD